MLLLLVSLSLLVSGKVLGQDLTINPTATPGTICVGGAVLLDAGANGGTGSYSYTWTSNPAGFSSFEASPTDSPAVTTTYNVEVFDGNTTINAQVVVTVNELPAITALNNSPVCTGTQLSLSGGPESMSSYTWTGPDGFSSSEQNPVVSASATSQMAGIYSLTIVDAYGCQNTSTTNVNVNATIPVSVSISASFNPVCSGTSVNFTATPTNGGSTPAYQWKVNGANVGTDDPTYNYVPDNGDVITCVLTSDATCATGSPATSNEVAMTVNALPTITGTLSFYLGSTMQLAGSGIPAVSSPWISSSPSVATVDNNGLVTSVSAGTSVITYTDINGCSSNTTVTINVVTFSTSFISGWNWFSVNTLQDDMTLAKVLPSVTSNLDYIKDQVNSATYYTGYGWFGSLAVIDPTKLYKIKVQNSSSVSYSGAPVNVSQTSISLVPGWNWIGYLPQSVQSIDNAFSSLSLSNLDYVKNQTKSATYYTGYGWFGPLTSLSPSEGYMIKIASPGTLKYSDTYLKNGAAILGETKDYSFDPTGFEFNGSLTAQILIGGVSAGSNNDTLYAYVDDQLRGLTVSYYFEPLGAYLFPIMIFSNKSDGEIIEFRYYNAQSNKFYSCKETIPFVKDMIVADAFHPYILNVNSVLTDDLALKSNSNLELKSYPNPFNDLLNIEYLISEITNVRLSVYDSNGKLIQLLIDEKQNPGNYKIQWDASKRPYGMYLIRLQSGIKRQIQKVILIR